MLVKEPELAYACIEKGVFVVKWMQKNIFRLFKFSKLPPIMCLIVLSSLYNVPINASFP